MWEINDLRETTEVKVIQSPVIDFYPLKFSSIILGYVFGVFVAGVPEFD